MFLLLEVKYDKGLIDIDNNKKEFRDLTQTRIELNSKLKEHRHSRE